MAVVQETRAAAPEARPALALFQPDIPQNAGAILRTADCFGVAVHLIHPAGFALSDRGLRRAGLDYLERATLIEHDDWTASASGRVHTLAGQLNPATNLGVQAAVIRGARAFVGTYGGYAYLAPFCGVPATAFFSRRTFKQHHLYAAQRAFEHAGAAALTVVDVSAAPLVQSALAALAAVHS